MESASANDLKTFTAIRANPAQTDALKKAFAISETISSEDLHALSVVTSLPSKWIGKWFGRQRAKVRAYNSKNFSGSAMHGASPSSMISSSENSTIMKEGDPPLLASSSPAADLHTSLSASVTASTSLAIIPPVDHPHRKRGRPRKNEMAPLRTLRSSNSKDSADPSNPVKAEPADTLVDLRYTPSPASGRAQSSAILTGLNPVGAGISDLKNLAALPIPAAYNHFLPKIAPPKRSAMTAVKMVTSSTSQSSPHSTATNQSMSIYARTSNSFARSRSNNTQKRATYGQGPIFHTQFQNNGPLDYLPDVNGTLENPRRPNSPSNILPPVFSYAEFAPALYVSDIPVSFYEPQVDAAGHDAVNVPFQAFPFDWENYAPLSSISTLPVSQAGDSSSYHLTNMADPQISSFEYDVNHQPKLVQQTIDLQRQLFEYSQDNSMQLPDPQIREAYREVLDPTLAPLKYLTGILENFTDKHGTYAKLLELEERDNLKTTLLEHDSVRTEPFQAAMALSLMSRLGMHCHGDCWEGISY